jgi:hypothetical protein
MRLQFGGAAALLLALSALHSTAAQNVYGAGPAWKYDPTVMTTTSGAHMRTRCANIGSARAAVPPTKTRGGFGGTRLHVFASTWHARRRAGPPLLLLLRRLRAAAAA